LKADGRLVRGFLWRKVKRSWHCGRSERFDILSASFSPTQGALQTAPVENQPQALRLKRIVLPSHGADDIVIHRDETEVHQQLPEAGATIIHHRPLKAVFIVTTSAVS
jgi:hypothetical protein